VGLHSGGQELGSLFSVAPRQELGFSFMQCSCVQNSGEKLLHCTALKTKQTKADLWPLSKWKVHCIPTSCSCVYPRDGRDGRGSRGSHGRPTF